MGWVAANEEVTLLRRGLTAWSEYEGMQLKGVVTRFEQGRLTASHSIVATIGHATIGKCPPMDIAFMASNPGEPHLGDASIIDTAIAFDGSVDAIFRRRYVSQNPPEARMSTVLLGNGIPGGLEHPASAIWPSIAAGFSLLNPRYTHSNSEALVKHNKLEILEKSTFLGVDCLRVRLTSPFDITAKEQLHPPIQVESLVATSPTFQGLKVLSLSGGEAGWAEEAIASYQLKSVESIRVMGDWLICDRVRYGNSDNYFIVEISEASRAPDEFTGMWNYNAITGANFSGDMEQTTRKGSPRQTYSHTKHVTFIPFTAEEQSKIRKYLLAQGVPVKPQVNWLTVAFIAANVIAVGVLGRVGYRRYFAKRFAVWFFCSLAVSVPVHAADGLSESEKQPIAFRSLPLAVAADDGYCGIAAAQYVASRLPTQSNGCGGCRPGAVVT